MTTQTTDIREETVSLTAADGHKLQGFRAAPRGASKIGRAHV